MNRNVEVSRVMGVSVHRRMMAGDGGMSMAQSWGQFRSHSSRFLINYLGQSREGVFNL